MTTAKQSLSSCSYSIINYSSNNILEPFTDFDFSEGKHFTRGKKKFLDSWTIFSRSRHAARCIRLSISHLAFEWERESSSSSRILDRAAFMLDRYLRTRSQFQFQPCMKLSL